MPIRSSFEILIAEDNPADVTLVREAVKEQGLEFTLHVMPDGARAIRFIEALERDPRHPRLDLVILDMHLPKHHGEEILRVLRSTEHYGQTPVIVMTASILPEDEEIAERNASLYFFRKPADLGEFLRFGEIVREILRNTRGAVEMAGPGFGGGRG